MINTLYIDIHAIQTAPPSCINRDDTGSPKTALYGGVERARVSSQAWKHAMRKYFKTIFAADDIGSRTKQLPKMIAESISALDKNIEQEKAMKMAMAALKNIGIKTDEKKNENSALFFISKQQVRALADLAVKGDTNKKHYELAVYERPSMDIALFGRMVADDPSLNYDAAAQVAHAISTHGVQTEYDYFTAVDDEKTEDESGAGHLGTIEFQSATLYRYATVNITELASNLKEETAKVVRAFVEAFACAMPTGKQNTFANRTLPDMLYITIRHDQPVNLSGAFERAVKYSEEGFVKKSCEELISYAEKLYLTFAEKPDAAFGCGPEELLSGHAEVFPLKAMLNTLENYVTTICKEVLS